MIAMLDSLVEVCQIFGQDKGDFFIQQCLSCLNNNKHYKVRLQVIKTLKGMSERLGLKKLESLVLPLLERLLEDPEDLVLLENIKLINHLVEKRLTTAKKCFKLLEQLLPFSFYPNAKVRLEVCRFVWLLSPDE
jgi:phosphoinositide-3-kinase regulatory subunit 4